MRSRRLIPATCIDLHTGYRLAITLTDRINLATGQITVGPLERRWTPMPTVIVHGHGHRPGKWRF